MSDIEDEFRELADEYYPGSKRKKSDRPAPVVLQAAHEWDRRPKIFKVSGEDKEFFTIGALAKALNREPVTIRMWMQTGILPEARYRTSDKGTQAGRRLWSRAQIEGLVQIAREEGVLSGSKIKNFAETKFTERAIAFLKETA